MAITESRVLPAQFIEDLGRDYGKQLSALTQLPVKTSAFAPTVAAQDPLQTAAYQQATDATTGLGAYQPYLTKAGTAADAATALTGPMTAQQRTDYMSPYQADVIDKALADYDIQAQKSRLGLGAQAVAGGAFGSGRHGIAEAEYQSASDRNRAALQAQMLQQGFQQAQQARQQDLANQMGIAGLQSKLGGGAQQLATQQISGLGTLGAGQQAFAQAQADAAAQAAQTAAYEPYQRLGTYGAGVTQLISGYPAQYKTAQTPSASPLQTALGVGTGLAGIYGGLTGKNPFGAIGQAVKSIF
tara:strand:- start:2688 stop:3587 length:900 start_codon:yes stop_codon:yes gene_type:complete